MHVCRGEVGWLIGANGAGKSTTLNTICGLVRVRSGEIRLFGENTADFTRDRLVRNGLSQVPEGRKLFSDMTVQENLELGAYLRKDKDGIARDMEHVYSLFPVLRERSRQMAGSLSGGEQQMCAIGRALMARPQLLLLDEPFSGLDLTIKTRLQTQMRELCAAFKLTLMLVAHDPLEAGALCHRAAVLEDGTIKETGALDALLANPKSLILRTFVEQLRDTGKRFAASAKPAPSAESP